MKKIHRLVLKSYLGPMILTFFIVMFVLLMNILWRYIDELVGKGLDMMVIIELLGYALTNMIPLGLPLATLLAAIMTLGNMGENYELLAMKSAGMSLMQIIKPLLWVVGIIAIGSFFVANNLVPAANKKFYSTLYDIRQMKQTLEFQDGLFFNGMENMSIRVGHQNKATGLLTDVLIYDNRNYNGTMTAMVADSGYIRLSDDKRFLEVNLFHGERYDQLRTTGAWYNNSTLRRVTFDQTINFIQIDGFQMQQTDADQYSSYSQTKNIVELDHEIDSLGRHANTSMTRAYDPLLKGRIFAKDTTVVEGVGRRGMRRVDLLDSLSLLGTREQSRLWTSALDAARSSGSLLTFDESQTKGAITQLYGDQAEWHKKIALPISIIIFFLIGAPLGAIIRKGGLGMPIVVSIIFFVIYYIISISGEKMAKEGTWEAVYGMWLPTFILAPIAIYLTYKATNDSGLLDVDWYRNKLKVLSGKLKAIIHGKQKSAGHD